MSAAQKYGRPQITSLSDGAMQQVQAAGQALAANGVKLTPEHVAATPAQRYGAPSSSAQQRSLVQGRSV